MITNLAGTRPGHALFLSGKRAVVIDTDALTASAPFPDYEIISSQWNDLTDPATLPTAAFALAEDAFCDLVVINASGKRSGKRTYAVPKNVRDAASRALISSADGTSVERDVATRLASGKPVSFELVRHVNMYFEHRSITAAATPVSGLWGGEPAAMWAEKIVTKELALRAAAEAPVDLGLSAKGAKNPIQLPPTEDDYDASTDPDAVSWDSVDPSEPHVFVPQDIVNEYTCAYCYAGPNALVHTDSMRTQVIANYGNPSEELADYDAFLATFDDAEDPEDAEPMTAAGPAKWFMSDPALSAPENALLASAFFGDREDPGADDTCDFHAEMGEDDDAIHKVYMRRGDDTWGQWNPQNRAWDEAGDASDIGLMPLDDNSAYVVAMKQSVDGMDAVPVRDVHSTEWALTDSAFDDAADEVDQFDTTEPEFFAQTAEDDSTQVIALYGVKDGRWYRWDTDTSEWLATPEPTNIAELEPEDAEEMARWLNHSAGADDFIEDSITAAIPKKRTRAPRANQPGVVPAVSSRVPGSHRSPYASKNTARGSTWFRSPGKSSDPNSYGQRPGEYGTPPTSGGDPAYTPQERSSNAKKQVRDGFGRFAKGGSRVDYAGGSGTITKVNPETQQVQIKSDRDNNTSWVNAKDIKVQPKNAGVRVGEPDPNGGKGAPNGPVTPAGGSYDKRVDPSNPYRTTDDKGEVWLPADGPRATKYTPKAQLKKLQPILDSAALNDMINNTSAYFKKERARAKKINKKWNSSEAITASANHDGVMVAFFLAPSQAEKFAVSGGEPPEVLHMTLAYLGDKGEVPLSVDELETVVRNWAATTPVITGEISGSGVFVNGETPVTHLSVDCADLPAARQSLVEALTEAGAAPRSDHGFDPHITLAYDDRRVPVQAEDVSFDHVTLSYGEDDRDIPLGPVTAAAEPKATAALTPDTSDVTPLRLAIVDELDKAAVLELLSLVPASAESTEPLLYRRGAKGWERDDNLLSKLRSATPPPVVTLDEATYTDVLTQVDQSLTAPPAPPAQAASGVAIDLYNEFGELLPAMVAVAGQEITPKDALAAERLRKYWTVGPGGAKIRWGQGGDFNRCVRHLTKYLGPRAKGYCQLRHHDVLGYYTSTHAKMLGGKHKRGIAASAAPMFDIPEEQLRVELLSAWERAENAPVTADGVSTEGGGARFRIPVVVPEGVPTGDGRVFKPLSVTTRDLPIPLLWQIQTADGHDGSVIIGRIDTIERISNGLGNAYGVFDTSPHAVEAERLVRHGFLRGVSADLDNFEAETQKPDAKEELGKESPAKSEKIAADSTTISKARVMAVTAVPKPAFQECSIEIIEDEPEQEAPVITDGVYSEREDETLVACALVASHIPVTPPADWFTNPALREPTPLTVTDDGRVYGHIAAWHVDHIGLPFGTKPPRSRSGYKYFHTGVVRTDNGKDVPVGQLTLAGGHAGLELTADAAVKHYDDTKSAVADVHAGEDQHGIWVAGALRPNVDAAQIRTLRASAPSGDWRPIQGRLEMVAVCQVNVPGFPVARARVASGYVTALVAAGAAPLAQLKGLSVEDRVKKLEGEALAAKMEAQRARMEPALAARSEALALQASAARERMEALRASAAATASYDADQREAFSRKGWALPDGSFAIATKSDLRDAVIAYGSLAACDKPGARRHIMKRARGLNAANSVPASWLSASIEERWADARATFTELAAQKSITASADVLTARDAAVARMSALRAAASTPTGEFDETRHPRNEETGKFRDVLARLREDVKGHPGGDDAERQIDHLIVAMDSNDKAQVESATDKVIKAVDDVAQATEADQPEIADKLRVGYAALGEALARLPLVQGDATATMRWTDLPPQLQTLVDDVMDKLKAKVDQDTYEKTVSDINSFKSGVDYATSDQIQSWLSGMLALLLD